jgi:hypothetical protein
MPSFASAMRAGGAAEAKRFLEQLGFHHGCSTCRS